MGAVDISVVISTYNRCELLRGALRSVLEQDADRVAYEVVVVDNNSTDRTRDVVKAFIEEGHENLTYVFEPRQGVSYGRNTGIQRARADIITFTDDDVRASRNWIANTKKAFDEHPEADFIGGRILPNWRMEPPAWLTRDHWWPLALLDCGDQPLAVNSENPICLPAANASFRRKVFERFGLFSSEFSGREDHEFLLRLWRAGRSGLYVPEILVTADVQIERMEKSYHLKWNTITGQFNSMMGLNELMGPSGGLVIEPRESLELFGVPASIYRRLLTESVLWLVTSITRHESRPLQHQNHVWYLLGYIRTRYQRYRAAQRRSHTTELLSFARTLARKKWPKAR